MFNKESIEKQLREYVLDAVRSGVIPCRSIILYTYGNKIYIHGVDCDELESWSITMEITESFDPSTFIEELKERVKHYEKEILATFPGFLILTR